MLSASKRFKILFSKQSLSRRQRFLGVTVFAGALLVSAMLMFGTKPAVPSVAAKADTDKRATCKAAPKTIFIRKNVDSQGIAPPPPPVRQYYKSFVANTSGVNAFNFRAGLWTFSFSEEFCPESGTCFGNCSGSMSCVGGAQALSVDGCNWKCCWCGTGNCSDFASCG